MLEAASINETIQWIKKMNAAFDSVGWDGEYIPATFMPHFGVIVGSSAAFIVKHLFITEKIKKYYEFKGIKSKGRAFAVEFQDR